MTLILKSAQARRECNFSEVLLLSWDKGTMGQAQNLAKEHTGPGQPVKIWDRMRDGMVQDFDSLSRHQRHQGQRGNGMSRPGLSRDVPWRP